MTTTICRQRPPQFRRHLRSNAGGDVTVIAVDGHLDEPNATAVHRHVDRRLPERTPLIVDLSGVTSLSAAGLRMLMAFADDFAPTGPPFALIINTLIDQILDATAPQSPPDGRLPAVGSMTAAAELTAIAAACPTPTLTARDKTRC